MHEGSEGNGREKINHRIASQTKAHDFLYKKHSDTVNKQGSQSQETFCVKLALSPII